METNIIGRELELEHLKMLRGVQKPAFLAVYGRRRVGKTFLIREAFNSDFAFYVTGMANASFRQQLTNFNIALNKYSPDDQKIEPADNWLESFVQLEQLLERNKSRKKVVFIDELPWFDTARSGFISALEHFWNTWASARKDILLIACGSAASWMINKLIRNTGGLYNRVTHRIKLEPFSLRECELFLFKKGSKYDRYQLIQLYMVMGGIPYYLEQVNISLSAARNIDLLCFHPNGLLNIEFDQLYRSLFKNSEKHIAIISALSRKNKGLTREELIATSGQPNSGNTTRLLQELAESGFIRKYIPFGKKEHNSLYQLSDYYSHFYLKFIKANHSPDKNRWINGLDDPAQRAWAGYAFEQVCLGHVQQIKQALGISGIQTSTSSWVGQGAQIDLVIDRRDRVVNLFEMKFSQAAFTINKSYAQQLRNKVNIFRENTRTNKSVFLTMITTFGLTKNEHSLLIVQNALTMDVLFQPVVSMQPF